MPELLGSVLLLAAVELFVSVEPASAVVEDLPCEIATATASK